MNISNKEKKLSEEHKRKIGLALKGKKYTLETKLKMSKSHKGKLHTVEARKRMSINHKGKHHSEETKLKMSKNNARPMLGKHFKHTEETKLKMRLARKGKPSSMLGKCHSKITREKMSKAQKGNKNHGYGKHLSGETKKKMSESRIKYLSSSRSKGKGKTFDTSIEVKMEQELIRIGIYYQKQIAICGVAVVDFYLPEWKIIIECDGDYWHNLPGRKNKDINKDFVLEFKGFKVFRLTETEINKSVGKCIQKVVDFIKGGN